VVRYDLYGALFMPHFPILYPKNTLNIKMKGIVILSFLVLVLRLPLSKVQAIAQLPMQCFGIALRASSSQEI